MTDARAGSDDTDRANTADADDGGTRFPSLDGSARMTRRRLEILAVLAERTWWKSRLAERFEASVQTIGRDVEALHADGLLRDTAVSPDAGHRHLYIAFATTEQGRAVLDEYRLCRRCGDVVDTRTGCVHDYAPVSEVVDLDGGDSR